MEREGGGEQGEKGHRGGMGARVFTFLPKPIECHSRQTEGVTGRGKNVKLMLEILPKSKCPGLCFFIHVPFILPISTKCILM